MQESREPNLAREGVPEVDAGVDLGRCGARFVVVVEREGEQGVHGARQRPAAPHIRVLEGLYGHGGAEHVDECGRHLEVVKDDPERRRRRGAASRRRRRRRGRKPSAIAKARGRGGPFERRGPRRRPRGDARGARGRRRARDVARASTIPRSRLPLPAARRTRGPARRPRRHRNSLASPASRGAGPCGACRLDAPSSRRSGRPRIKKRTIRPGQTARRGCPPLAPRALGGGAMSTRVSATVVTTATRVPPHRRAAKGSRSAVVASATRHGRRRRWTRRPRGRRRRRRQADRVGDGRVGADVGVASRRARGGCGSLGGLVRQARADRPAVPRQGASRPRLHPARRSSLLTSDTRPRLPISVDRVADRDVARPGVRRAPRATDQLKLQLNNALVIAPSDDVMQSAYFFLGVGGFIEDAGVAARRWLDFASGSSSWTRRRSTRAEGGGRDGRDVCVDRLRPRWTS